MITSVGFILITGNPFTPELLLCTGAIKPIELPDVISELLNHISIVKLPVPKSKSSLLGIVK